MEGGIGEVGYGLTVFITLESVLICIPVKFISFINWLFSI